MTSKFYKNQRNYIHNVSVSKINILEGDHLLHPKDIVLQPADTFHLWQKQL
jgi:hypothetical protein